MVLKVPRFASSVLSVCSLPYSLLGFGDILVPGKYIHGGQGTGENEECGSSFFRDRLERGISLFRDSGNYLIIKSIFLFVNFKHFCLASLGKILNFKKLNT